MKIFMTVVTLLLVFSATAQVARAQKDGEAQVVSFDQNNWAPKGSRSGGAKSGHSERSVGEAVALL